MKGFFDHSTRKCHLSEADKYRQKDFKVPLYMVSLFLSLLYDFLQCRKMRAVQTLCSSFRGTFAL